MPGRHARHKRSSSPDSRGLREVAESPAMDADKPYIRNADDRGIADDALIGRATLRDNPVRQRPDLVQRHRDTMVIAVMLAAAACLFVLRSPTSLTAATFWAEDGTVFFKDAIEHGWGATFTPYAGQIFVAQRFAAALFGTLPVSWQPTLYAGVAIILAVLACGIVLSQRWRDPVPISARFACMAALLCAPGVGEAFGKLTTAHWWLGVGLILLGMLRDPARGWTRIGEVGYVALTAMSGFVALFGIPALTVRAYRNKSRHSITLVALALLGVGLQLGFLVSSNRRGVIADVASDPVVALLVLAKRVIGTAGMGETGLAVLWPLRSPDTWAAFLCVALTAALASVWIRGRSLEIGALLLALIGGWLLALWAMTQPGLSIEMLFWPMAAARFFLIPRAVLYVSLVVSWPLDGTRKLVLALTCILLVVGIVLDYQQTGLPAVDWAPFAHCVDHTAGRCSIEIPPGWLLQVEARGP